MRPPRNFLPDRCYHLISRVAHRAFYLNEEERTRFVERMRRVACFAVADVSPDGEGREGIGMKLLHHSYSTNGVSNCSLSVRSKMVGRLVPKPPQSEVSERSKRRKRRVEDNAPYQSVGCAIRGCARAQAMPLRQGRGGLATSRIRGFAIASFDKM